MIESTLFIETEHRRFVALATKMASEYAVFDRVKAALRSQLNEESDTAAGVLALWFVTRLFFGKGSDPMRWHGFNIKTSVGIELQTVQTCMSAMMEWLLQFWPRQRAHAIAKRVCFLACGNTPAESLVGWLVPIASAPNSRNKNRGITTVDNSLPMAVYMLPHRHPLRCFFLNMYVRLQERTQIQSSNTMRSCLLLLFHLIMIEPCIEPVLWDFPNQETKVMMPPQDEESPQFEIIDYRGCVKNDEAVCGFFRAAGVQSWEDVVKRYHAHRTGGGTAGRPAPCVQTARVERDVYWLSAFFHRAVPLFPESITLANVLTGAYSPTGSIKRPLEGPVDMGLQLKKCMIPRRYERPGDGPIQERVHAFSAGEVRNLYLACVGTLEQLLVCLFFTTALRIGGICRIRRCHVAKWSEPSQRWIVGTHGCTLEKGRHFHTFAITHRCRMLLEDWLNQKDGPLFAGYVFPERVQNARQGIMNVSFTHPLNSNGTFEAYHKEGDGCCDPTYLRGIFHRIARAAGVTGKHVHPHTCRHTVAVCLNLLGNRMEHIAQFLGNIDIDVTARVYARLSAKQREERMIIPWLDQANQVAHRLSEAAELAAALAGPLMTPSNDTNGTCFVDASKLIDVIQRQQRELGICQKRPHANVSSLVWDHVHLMIKDKGGQPGIQKQQTDSFSAATGHNRATLQTKDV